MAYMQEKDVDEIISSCFRKPDEGEKSKPMNCSQLLKLIQQQYPTVPYTHGVKVQIGKALMRQEYNSYTHAKLSYYYAIPKEVER